ncbi:hypothetical protein FGE12_22515 [Aggregicoccus sp. 17bor-14]|uniref:DUF3592 domain-containing protein n=1 Tax=Myxococcaceae TaxID=31 RepID=UPI00129CC415|nr:MULTISPECIES: DUF3592 domain-containing protein [Myxococcaceae]MBF5045195.1 hypothetical protein [Simulacricoccus sp. 17bor-14]MRI90936.1 hypothetical protein [Aggregicoccus sp. 17bor-14]
MTSSDGTLLGPSPWQIDTKRRRRERIGAYLLFAFMVAFGGLMVWFASTQTRDVWNDSRVWRHGEAGQVLDYSGDVRTSGPLGIPVFHDFKLDVTYEDAQGEQRTGHVEFQRLFAGVNTDVTPEVRVDPRRPERFVLAWQVELPRWLASLIFLLLPMVVLGGAKAIFSNERRRHAMVGLCARDGEEQYVPLEKITKQKNVFRVTVVLPGADGAPARKHTETLKQPPVLVSLDGVQHVLAAVSPRAPGQVLVLEENGGPFVRSFETAVAPAEEPGARATGT